MSGKFKVCVFETLTELIEDDIDRGIKGNTFEELTKLMTLFLEYRINVRDIYDSGKRRAVVKIDRTVNLGRDLIDKLRDFGYTYLPHERAL